MNNNPLISVIVPCYNSQDTIEDSLRSIKQQTYKNIEVIICDDGSSDNTVDLVEGFVLSDKRFNLIKNDNNKGLIFTLNRLVDESKGEYVCRIDSDDKMTINRVERQLSYMLNNEVIGVGSWYKQFSAKKKLVKLPLIFNDIVHSLPFTNPFCHPSMMIRRDVMVANRYNSKFLHAEDYELWVRLIRQGYKLENIKCVTTLYRVHPEQVSTSNSEYQKNIAADIKTIALGDGFSSANRSSFRRFWLGKALEEDVDNIYYIFETLVVNPVIYNTVRKEFILSLLKNFSSASRFYLAYKTLTVKDFLVFFALSCIMVIK